MPLSDNQLHYFASYAVAFVTFGLIGRWYLWPALKDKASRTALTPLLLYASFRVNGLMFLMPGLVSANLQKAFAIPTAYESRRPSNGSSSLLAKSRMRNAAGH